MKGMLSTYPPAKCGIATYCSYLVEHFDQTLVFTEKSNRKTEGVVPSFEKGTDYADDIIKSLKEHSVELIHIQHEFGIFGWDNRFLDLLESIKKSGIKSVVTLHTIYSEGIRKCSIDIEDYYLHIAKHCDKIIVHQKECKTVLMRIGLPEKQISVISHGTKLCKTSTNNLFNHEKVMLYLGFLKKVKLSSYFIEALPAIFRQVPEAHFYCTGCFRTNDPRDIKHVEYIKSLIRKNRIQDKVTFINRFIEEDELADFMSHADVVVYPYDIEYWGDTGSAHRAIGAGVPIIVSRIPKFDEIKNEIHEEIAVLPHRSDGWARVMTRMLTDDRFREYIIDRTKKYALKTCWKNIACQHSELYNSMLDNKVYL